MNSTIHITQTNVLKGVVNYLPASKSISNRVLIMNALAGSGSSLLNLSDANDTQLMLKLINTLDHVVNVEDAGTTMRFLTAYFSITGKQKILTGTSRMKERPIGILVDALRTLGAEIRYIEKNGFPPLELKGFEEQKVKAIAIRGDISSQFISALMMIAPILPDGLTLNLTGKIGSRPYIEMTASLMREFGVMVDFYENTIHIKSQRYTATSFTVESDWSAASYWFAFAALAEKAELFLPRLMLKSLQGDSVITHIMKDLGVIATTEKDLVKLTKATSSRAITWDFTHCPDLAQTLAVVCAAKGITGNFTGLESLRIKETDRIAALQQELRKIGADLQESADQWTLIPSLQLPKAATFQTYKDHRMAMAFAPLATQMDISIENPNVVRKSYPRFWDDINTFGLITTISEG
ncbi:MAG: 3-phosphoshikimate 1-carboxyvinyltransferase [Cyclobacteriaceae bacterium]|nr:3-phosphoshikimate 1-carboxyvinyltransferase [Cyclobacteriaceae bacterium]